MATFGWKLGSPSDNNNNNVIATTQSVDSGGRTAQPQTAVDPNAAPQTPLAPIPAPPPATMPTRADGPPVRGDFYSGTANHWVDPTYRTDANGNPLSPEQQAYWRDYDRKRAEAASIARSNNVGGGGTPDPSISGIIMTPRLRAGKPASRSQTSTTRSLPTSNARSTRSFTTRTWRPTRIPPPILSVETTTARPRVTPSQERQPPAICR
jgi:hypothetical protein